MGKYSFKLISNYESEDLKYNNLIQSTLVFQKVKNYEVGEFQKNFEENYLKIKLIHDIKILSELKNKNESFLFSLS